jgi:hypothetical protein
VRLEGTGIFINNVKHDFRVSKFICDVPARSFLNLNHNSYHGCERCIQEGSYLGRVVFQDFESPQRTDISFKNKLDLDHHTGDSPLIKLRLDPIAQFPLDYMHLVCLGVTRKLIYSWIKGPLKTRLLPRNIARISAKLIDLQRHIPSELRRKPKSL